jgi:hypothetical protein
MLVFGTILGTIVLVNVVIWSFVYSSGDKGLPRTTAVTTTVTTTATAQTITTPEPYATRPGECCNIP